MQRWTIPVCFKTSGQPICRVLTPEDSALPVPVDASLPFLYANAGNKGYYRTAYTPAQYKAIVANVETALTPSERIGLLSDRWALVRSGQGTVGDYLDLFLALKNDPNAAVFDLAQRQLERVEDDIANDQDRAQLAALLRRELGPVYTALGAPAKGESFDRQQLRGTLFEILGAAHDPAILAQARQIAGRVYPASGPADRSLDPALVDAALRVAAASGDTALYDKVLDASRDPRDPGLRSQALRTLARFREPALVTRTLDYAVSGQVRTQDSWTVLADLLKQRETRDQTWDYIQRNWDKVHAQFTTNSGVRVVNATGYFCTAAQRDSVAGFFASHKVDASARTLAKAIDSINACIQVRATQQPRLRQWLQSGVQP